MKFRNTANKLIAFTGLITAIVFTLPTVSATILLNQDFEAPNTFFNGFDVDSRPVNTLFGNQPAGFTYGNTFTVETINVTDSANPSDSQKSFASIGGYQGDLAQSGNFVVGMLSHAQNDRLGLTFDVSGFDFLNVQIDVTSLELDCCGAPFVTGAPTFRFSLFEDAGSNGIGSGSLLDSFDLAGTASAGHILDFTTGTFGLDASNSSDGLVTLQIDLLSGGYAAFDNLIIASSDTEGDVGQSVTEPGIAWLFLSGMVVMSLLRRRRFS
ncbi:MAG: hypothetical protein GKR93_04560 [Gammaproteobacteria bacterium]|nr:hypothetical protein [Gammaproteobacteria bacterium]